MYFIIVLLKELCFLNLSAEPVPHENLVENFFTSSIASRRKDDRKTGAHNANANASAAFVSQEKRHRKRRGDHNEKRHHDIVKPMTEKINDYIEGLPCLNK